MKREPKPIGSIIARVRERQSEAARKRIAELEDQWRHDSLMAQHRVLMRHREAGQVIYV